MSGSSESESQDLLMIEDQDHFNELPDELVVLIFSHLSPEDLACHVCKVCLRWQTVAKYPVLWKGAVLVYDELNPLEFQMTIRFAPFLDKVEINMFRFMRDDCVQSILSGTTHVMHLSFYPSPAVPVHQKLDILNHYCSSLKGLNMYIDDSYFPSHLSESLLEVLSNMTCLEELTLRGLISSQFLRHEFFINGWESLISLDISGLTVSYQTDISICGVPNPWQTFILCILEHRAPTLKRLSLPEGVFDLSVENLLERKCVSSCIENLKIDEVSLCLVKNLNCLRTLHVVGMSHRHLDVMRRHCLSSTLCYSSLFHWVVNTDSFLKIKELTLENIFHDERNLTIQMLKACKNLESLTLFSGCAFPAELAFMISQLFPTLSNLNIHHMPCLRSRHLELLLWYVPNLQILNLRYNTLTDGILQHYRDSIQDKMPNLQLLCDWGYWNKNGGKPWKNNVSTMKQLPKSMNIAFHESSSSNDILLHDRDRIRKVLNAINDYDDDSD